MVQKKAFSYLWIDRLAKFKHQLLQIEKQTRFVSTSPMFVSRACLGKMIVFSTVVKTRLKKGVFHTFERYRNSGDLIKIGLYRSRARSLYENAPLFLSSLRLFRACLGKLIISLSLYNTPALD
jgi:hypothetical protein